MDDLGLGGPTMSGTCRWFNPMKGFGFITCDDGSPDIFVHAKNISSYTCRQRTIQGGEKVWFDVEVDATSGKRSAVAVMGPGGTQLEGAERIPRKDKPDAKATGTEMEVETAAAKAN